MDEFIGFFAFENFIHIGLLSQCIFIDILLHGTLKLLDSVILKFLSKLEKFLFEKWEKEYIWKTSCHPSRTQSTWTYFYVEKCRKAKIQNLKNEKKNKCAEHSPICRREWGVFFLFLPPKLRMRMADGGWRSFFHRAQRRDKFITQPVGSWAEVEGGVCRPSLRWWWMNAVAKRREAPPNHPWLPSPVHQGPRRFGRYCDKKIIKNKLAPNEKEITKTVRVKAPFDKKKSE